MKILYLLENLRISGLNEIMLLITRLGEETAFLAIALIVFWCVDKKRGYLLMAVGFGGILINQFLKLACRIPRPWVLDPEFPILEQAREAAAGYSFPSGHTQNAFGTFGSLAVTARCKAGKAIFWTLAVLVGFSRMYIGVHTPWDVAGGAAISLALILLLRKPVTEGRAKQMRYILTGLLILSIGLLLYVEKWQFPADMDLHNLTSGMKNAYTMAGCLLAVAIVYPVERKYVKFETKAIWWAQILKTALGIASVLAVKEGLRGPLEAVFGIYPGRAVRYFLVVVTAGLLWPMTFRWFSRLGEKK